MRPVYELAIMVIVAIVWVFVYQNYWDDVQNFFDSGVAEYTIYLNDVALQVTVADEYEERVQGLSGVESLDDFEGKLFIFDQSGQHGIWMKDMLFPIDILWFDENLILIHVESNVSPDTYPEVFAPEGASRFVLETKAYFTDSLRVQVGERLILPPEILPNDVRNRLQQ